MYIDCMLAAGALKATDDFEEGKTELKIDMEYAFQNCQHIAQTLYVVKYYEIQRRNKDASFAAIVNGVFDYFWYVNSRIEEIVQ